MWLSTKAAEIGITATSGFAIVATGGLGRREFVPYSDLDLMLLHDNLPDDVVTQVAEQLWYPLWDANIRLDHSVRTVADALAVAGSDLSAGLAMLEARHICGNADLSSSLIGGARRQWRAGIAGRFEELAEQARVRWQRSGQIAHRAEPDLKSGKGGLRDVQLLNALAVAQLADVYPSSAPDSPAGSPASAHLALLNVRTELHRVSGRGRDQLLAQYADETGAALRVGDRFDLARVLSDAARTVSYYVDAGLRTAANALPRRGLSALRRPARRPLDEGVVEFAGEVILARDARPQRDPGLTLRVAAASATTGIPIAASTLARLAETAPELRAPWPRDALEDLLVLLTAGPPTVTVIEALDRTGLWGRIFPEWGAVRICRRATRFTFGRWTATWSKPSPVPVLSRPGSRDPTCWCSVPYCTTSGRGAVRTTAWSVPNWPPGWESGWDCGPLMSEPSRRWFGITFCCRRRPPTAILRIQRLPPMSWR